MPNTKRPIIGVNAEHQSLTLQQLKTKVEESDVKISVDKLHRWTKATSVQRKKHRITPSLPTHHKRNRADFIIDQAGMCKKVFKDGFYTIHVDGA